MHRTFSSSYKVLFLCCCTYKDIYRMLLIKVFYLVTKWRQIVC